MEKVCGDNCIIEEQKPKRFLIKNDTLLFVCVAFSAVLLSFLISYICMITGIPYLWFSLGLYVFFGIITVWLYRSALVTFRYTLSERMLSAVRVIGKKESPEVQIHLSDITYVGRYSGKKSDGKASKVGHGTGNNMLLVRYRSGRKTEACLLSVSDGFETEVVARVKLAKK